MRLVSSHGFVTTKLGIDVATMSDERAVALQTDASAGYGSVSRLCLFGTGAFLSRAVGGSMPPGAFDVGTERPVLSIADGEEFGSPGHEELSLPRVAQAYLYGSGMYDYLDSGSVPHDDEFYMEFKGLDGNGGSHRVSRYSMSLQSGARVWILLWSSRPSEMVDMSGASCHVPTAWCVFPATQSSPARHARVRLGLNASASMPLSVPGKSGYRTFYAAFPTSSEKDNSLLAVACDSLSWSEGAASFARSQAGRVVSLGSIAEGTTGVADTGGSSRNAGNLPRLGENGRLDGSMASGGSSDWEQQLASEAYDRASADDALDSRVSSLADGVNAIVPGVRDEVDSVKGRIGSAESSIASLSSRVEAAETGLSSVSGGLSGLSTHVGEYPSGVGTSVESRLSDLSDHVGSYPTGVGTSVEDRLDDANGAIDDIQGHLGEQPAGSGSIEDRIAAIDDGVDALSYQVGDASNPRVGSLEQRVVDLDGRVGRYSDSNDQYSVYWQLRSIDGRVTSAEDSIVSVNGRVDSSNNGISAANVRIDSLSTHVGEYPSGVDTSVESRLSDLSGQVGTRTASGSVETRLYNLSTHVGNYPSETSTPLETRLSGLSGDLSDLSDHVGSYPSGVSSDVETRLSALKSSVDGLGENLSLSSSFDPSDFSTFSVSLFGYTFSAKKVVMQSDENSTESVTGWVLVREDEEDE